jgi:hypothetical protein
MFDVDAAWGLLVVLLPTVAGAWHRALPGAVTRLNAVLFPPGGEADPGEGPTAPISRVYLVALAWHTLGRAALFTVLGMLVVCGVFRVAHDLSTFPKSICGLSKTWITDPVAWATDPARAYCALQPRFLAFSICLLLALGAMATLQALLYVRPGGGAEATQRDYLPVLLGMPALSLLAYGLLGVSAALYSRGLPAPAGGHASGGG